jgi:hypothetical protein
MANPIQNASGSTVTAERGQTITVNPLITLDNSTPKIIAHGLVPDPAVVNLPKDSHFNLSADGIGTTHPVGPLEINIGSTATLHGGLRAFAGGPMTIQGGAFDNDSSLVQGSDVLVLSNVVGTGQFVLSALIESGAQLQFLGAVSPNQQFTINGMGSFGPKQTRLEIAHGKDFHSSVTLSSGEIDLHELANADSYTFANDTVSIFEKTTVIAKIPVHNSGQQPLEVVKLGDGVLIENDGFRSGGTLLGLHH